MIFPHKHKKKLKLINEMLENNYTIKTISKLTQIPLYLVLRVAEYKKFCDQVSKHGKQQPYYNDEMKYGSAGELKYTILNDGY